MFSRAERNGKALSLLIVLSLALGGIFTMLIALSPAARAGTCDQVGGVITSTWTVTTTQVCTGILYTVDATININSGGSLTLINGGLSFAKDTSHESYALNVNAGGELVLDNSLVTTQPNAINPYLKLALTVSGAGSHFAMRNGAMLKFPGWFNASGASIDVTKSTITGFTAADLTGVGLYTDDNDDSPLIAWSSTTASLYASRIERIYENSSASGGNATGKIEGNVTLTAGSALYAYDTYIGADFSNVMGLHNELQVDATSNAYLYNVTTDSSQNPISKTQWQSAFRPLAAGGNIYLLRWLHVSIVDSTAFPVSGATIWSELSPSATTAQYPDNGFSTTPSARTLAYLGKTASGATAWNRTDPNGAAQIPLYTDLITTATLPNAQSFGNYQLTASYATSTASGGVDFNPYPATNWDDNNKGATVSFSNLQVRTGPDLMLRQSDYPGTKSVIQNQPFTVYALIYNQGQTTGTNVDIAAYVDASRTAQVARVNGLTVAPPGPINVTLNVVGVSVVGAHTLELFVDPDNTINEGGLAQESNNFANITLNVQPPPAGFVAIASPQAGETVQPGTQISVTGYVRDTSQNPIAGVVVTIELRNSGGVAVASNTTQSDTAGFFIGILTVPAGSLDGSYTIVVTPSTSQIQTDSRAITVSKSVSFIYTPVPFLGIQWWLFLIVLAAAVAGAIGVTLYWKVFGLGKMVECGECGAFIPEDATTCPKCGVEFERDMAKCSNCQAWIPVSVKQCPECGVEFATGQLEMADYQQKMRLQYDEVVSKFKQEASRQLGRALSETEFQDWWRKQPTFLTFEDWLREEEEMRKMGSKPCPVCGTLNSVTATVCHKCGSLMRDQRGPGGGAVVAGAPARRTTGRTPPPPDSSTAPPPVVQKRVIKKPMESKEGEGSGQSGEKSGEDEL